MLHVSSHCHTLNENELQYKYVRRCSIFILRCNKLFAEAANVMIWLTLFYTPCAMHCVQARKESLCNANACARLQAKSQTLRSQHRVNVVGRGAAKIRFHAKRPLRLQPQLYTTGSIEIAKKVVQMLQTEVASEQCQLLVFFRQLDLRHAQSGKFVRFVQMDQRPLGLHAVFQLRLDVTRGRTRQRNLTSHIVTCIAQQQKETLRWQQ